MATKAKAKSKVVSKPSKSVIVQVLDAVKDIRKKLRAELNVAKLLETRARRANERAEADAYRNVVDIAADHRALLEDLLHSEFAGAGIDADDVDGALKDVARTRGEYNVEWERATKQDAKDKSAAAKSRRLLAAQQARDALMRDALIAEAQKRNDGASIHNAPTPPAGVLVPPAPAAHAASELVDPPEGGLELDGAPELPPEPTTAA